MLVGLATAADLTIRRPPRLQSIAKYNFASLDLGGYTPPRGLP